MRHGAMRIRAGGSSRAATVPRKLESKHKDTPPPKCFDKIGEIQSNISGLELRLTRAGHFAALRRWRNDALAATKSRLADDLPMPAHFRRALADMEAGRSPRDVALAHNMRFSTCERLRSTVESRRSLSRIVHETAPPSAAKRPTTPPAPEGSR